MKMGKDFFRYGVCQSNVGVNHEVLGETNLYAIRTSQ